MKLKVLGATVLSFLALATVGCAASNDEPASGLSSEVTSQKTIQASNDAKHGMLEGLWAVRQIEGDFVSLRLYELGGGDPAVNGNQLWLGACGEQSADGCSMFELGVSVRSVDKVEIKAPGTIVLNGVEDRVDAEGEILPNQRWEATITYSVKDNDGLVVDPTISVKKDAEASTTVQASADPAARFLQTVFRMHSAEMGESGYMARVFETAGGDPAMNGVNAYLSISELPYLTKTFDLDLDVAGVTKISFTSAYDLRVEGTKDSSADGWEVQSRAFAYSAKFSVNPGDDAEINDAVTLRSLTP